MSQNNNDQGMIMPFYPSWAPDNNNLSTGLGFPHIAGLAGWYLPLDNYRFCTRVVGVANVPKDFGYGNGTLSYPGAAGP